MAFAVNERASRTVLKRDLLGSVCRLDLPAQGSHAGSACIERDTRDARWWLRLAARRLAAREARALAALQQVPGLPRLLQRDIEIFIFRLKTAYLHSERGKLLLERNKLIVAQPKPFFQDGGRAVLDNELFQQRANHCLPLTPKVK